MNEDADDLGRSMAEPPVLVEATLRREGAAEADNLVLPGLAISNLVTLMLSAGKVDIVSLLSVPSSGAMPELAKGVVVTPTFDVRSDSATVDGCVLCSAALGFDALEITLRVADRIEPAEGVKGWSRRVGVTFRWMALRLSTDARNECMLVVSLAPSPLPGTNLLPFLVRVPLGSEDTVELKRSSTGTSISGDKGSESAKPVTERKIPWLISLIAQPSKASKLPS
jgi:hypothetical protein